MLGTTEMVTLAVVDFRFGDKWFTKDFVQPQNPTVIDEYKVMIREYKNRDVIVKRVAEYINREYKYPTNVWGRPSPEGKLLRYKLFRGWWRWSRFEEYIWQFPAETIVTRKGICIDTSLLATSLLRHPRYFNGVEIDAWVIIGVVLDINDNILGYHAWVETPYKGDIWLIETTVHDINVDNMVPIGLAYNKHSDWAQVVGLYYKPIAKFNEIDYREYPTPGEKVMILQVLGKNKKLIRKQEKIKQEAIWRAFGVKKKRRLWFLNI